MRLFLGATLLCAACMAALPSAAVSNFVSKDGKITQAVISEIWAKVGKEALRACRQQNRGANATRCDIQLILEPTRNAPPSARAWIADDGRPSVAINLAMIDQIQSKDELAFVLAHETAHLVLDHVGHLHTAQLDGGFVITRAAPKHTELEADAIGASIAFDAGFDPLAGRDILKRVMANYVDGGGTHPALAQRLVIVERAAAVRAAGDHIAF